MIEQKLPLTMLLLTAQAFLAAMALWYALPGTASTPRAALALAALVLGFSPVLLNLGVFYDYNGFEVRTFFRRKRYQWGAVAPFEAKYAMPFGELVFQEYLAGAKEARVPYYLIGVSAKAARAELNRARLQNWKPA